MVDVEILEARTGSSDAARACLQPVGVRGRADEREVGEAGVVCRDEDAVAGTAGIDDHAAFSLAGDGEALVDVQGRGEGVGAIGDEDLVAVDGVRHGRRNAVVGGDQIVRCVKELDRVGEVEHGRTAVEAQYLDAGQRVGPFVAVSGVAIADRGEARDEAPGSGRGDRVSGSWSGIGGRVGAEAAGDAVVAVHAGENIVAVVAGEDVRVGVARAIDVVAAKQNQIIGACGQGEAAGVYDRDLARHGVAGK